MVRYRTIDGDVLDRIAHDRLGSAALVTAILEANPGLARQPSVLPAGIEIMLPEVAPPATAARIRLWGSA